MLYSNLKLKFMRSDQVLGNTGEKFIGENFQLYFLKQMFIEYFLNRTFFLWGKLACSH